METHLSPREQQVVSLIAAIPDQPDFPTIAELAESKLEITSTNTAALLDKLLKKGVVGREGTRRKYKYFVAQGTPAPLPVKMPAPPMPKPMAKPMAQPAPKTEATKPAPKPAAVKTPAPKPAPVKAEVPAPVSAGPVYELHNPEAVRQLISNLVDRVEALTAEVKELRAENEQLASRKQMDYYTPNLIDRMRAIGINVAP